MLFHPKKCTEIISRMSMNQISLFIFAAVKAECLPIICENSEIKEALTKKLNCIIEGSGLGTALCLSMKQMLGGTLSETEKAEVSSYLKENPFREYSIFWKECSDATGFILSIFDDLSLLQKIRVNLDFLLPYCANMGSTYYQINPDLL